MYIKAYIGDHWSWIYQYCFVVHSLCLDMLWSAQAWLKLSLVEFVLALQFLRDRQDDDDCLTDIIGAAELATH